MAKRDIAVRHTESILDEIARRDDEIRQRAFELFRSHADAFMCEMDDWLNAERELSPQPSIDMRETDGRIEIDADIPGMELKDLDVKVTKEDVLITAEHAEKHEGREEGAAKTDTIVRMFRAIHLPVTIDPDAVKAEYHKGHLRVTAPIVRPKAGTVVEVRASN